MALARAAGPRRRSAIRLTFSHTCRCRGPRHKVDTMSALKMSALRRSNCREVRVVCSGAFRAAYQVLVAQFEEATGRRVVTAWGSSAAGAATSIPARLAAGEPLDLVIMAREGLDRLIRQGLVVGARCTDLARCGIGVAVRTGAPWPDLTSAEAFIGALKQAKAIAYSSSASGIYLKGLLQRLGLAELLGSRMKQ